MERALLFYVKVLIGWNCNGEHLQFDPDGT